MISSLIGVLLIVIIVVLNLLKSVVDGVNRIIIVGETSYMCTSYYVHIICFVFQYYIYYYVLTNNLFFMYILLIIYWIAKNVRLPIGMNIRQHANASAKTAKNGMKT